MHTTGSGYSFEEMERDLDEMQRSLDARSVFVADDAGQIISLRPNDVDLDVPVLGALAVANLAATRQIVYLVDDGEQPQSQLLIIETPSGSVLLCGADNMLSLVVILRPESPLGLARLMAQEMTARISKLPFPAERDYRIDEGGIDEGDEWSEGIQDIVDQLGDIFS